MRRTNYSENMLKALKEAQRLAPHATPGAPRPVINPEDIGPYLNWIASKVPPHQLEHHLTLAELAVRTKANEAQNKATQHTLVEDGVIAPPPSAS